MDNTGALLEQVRKLERGLSEPVRGETGEAGASPQPLTVQGRLKERTVQSAVEKASAGGEPGRENKRNDVAAMTGFLERSPDASPYDPAAVERMGQASAGSEENVRLRRASGGSEEGQLRQVPDASEEKKRTGEGSVLLEQLMRLEQAAALGIEEAAEEQSAAWSGRGKRNASLTGAAVERYRNGFSDMTGTSGEGWAAGSVFTRPGPIPAEDIQRAERTDKIFRRDSRRYDGGFYLF